jgi:methylthioribose-1-phosphate isomerase
MMNGLPDEPNTGSTIDTSRANFSLVPIVERAHAEVTHFGKTQTAPADGLV